MGRCCWSGIDGDGQGTRVPPRCCAWAEVLDREYYIRYWLCVHDTSTIVTLSSRTAQSIRRPWRRLLRPLDSPFSMLSWSWRWPWWFAILSAARCHLPCFLGVRVFMDALLTRSTFLFSFFSFSFFVVVVVVVVVVIVIVIVVVVLLFLFVCVSVFACVAAFFRARDRPAVDQCGPRRQISAAPERRWSSCRSASREKSIGKKKTPTHTHKTIKRNQCWWWPRKGPFQDNFPWQKKTNFYNRLLKNGQIFNSFQWIRWESLEKGKSKVSPNQNQHWQPSATNRKLKPKQQKIQVGAFGKLRQAVAEEPADRLLRGAGRQESRSAEDHLDRPGLHGRRTLQGESPGHRRNRRRDRRFPEIQRSNVSHQSIIF